MSAGDTAHMHGNFEPISSVQKEKKMLQKEYQAVLVSTHADCPCFPDVGALELGQFGGD